MDITSEIERLILLKQLSIEEPRISTTDLEQKLNELAVLLTQGSDRSKKESNTYTKILAEIENSRNKNWTTHEL